MPQIAPPLSAQKVKSLRKSPGMHNVGGVPGLLLQVTPSCAASWVLRATIHGRVRMMGLGSYSKITLEKARLLAHDAHAVIADGGDPIEKRRSEKRRKAAAVDRIITFKEAAERYHRNVKAKELRNEKSRADWLKLVERHAYPIMGDLPVGEVERSHVIKVLEQQDCDGKKLWPRPVGQYVRSSIELVLGWAAVRGYREGDNPARWKANLDVDLPKPSKSHKVRHFAALPWKEGPSFIAELRKVETFAAKALEFVILTAARSGEVRQATWEEIDLDARLWTVPEEHTKGLREHRVPLSNAAIKLLESLPHREGLLFRGGKYEDRELYDFELGGKLKLGRDVTVHGWRSSFKDWARSLGTRYTDEASELALAHVSRDATRAAYARDELLPERSRLMQEWAEFLETGQSRIATITKIGEKKA